MLFNSFEFFFFFSLVLFFYYVCPFKYRWILLLISSYIFYMFWKPVYIVLILTSTVISYFVAIQISKTANKKSALMFLTAGFFINLGLLLIFKYLDFANNSMRALFYFFGFEWNISDFNLILPVGISFYTFQTLGYTFDVFRGTAKAERHFGRFALFVAYFPQLVAGPIERSKHLLPQFLKEVKLDFGRIRDGIMLMSWGMFKKVVIADRLGELVDYVYANPTQYEGTALILAPVFFAFQIFCDFSGYSDIAIGAAQTMGIDIMNNFRQPYSAKSFADFWRRWHISLSTWFRDYLYIPLGGSRVTLPKYYINLFITFLICGLWHGANWTFIAWGALHGTFLVLENFTQPFRIKISRNVPVSIWNAAALSLVFSLICFSWIIFRASSISQATYIATHLFSSLSFKNVFDLGLSKEQLSIAPYH